MTPSHPFVYKILRVPEWNELQAKGSTPGAPVDVHDGFVHFSTAEQAEATAQCHFADAAEVVMLQMRTAPMGDALRYEPSRGGQLFPHLYGPLERAHVAHHWRVPRPSDGVWQLGIAPGEIVHALPPRDELVALYNAVGWTSYTKNPDQLVEALRGSAYVATIWAQSRLVGLVRCISDDATIAYLQDVLVHPDLQRAGLGRRLVAAAQERFAHCRQFVLITDDRPEQTAFYEAMGLVRIDKATSATLRAFAKMPGLS